MDKSLCQRYLITILSLHCKQTMATMACLHSLELCQTFLMVDGGSLGVFSECHCLELLQYCFKAWIVRIKVSAKLININAHTGYKLEGPMLGNTLKELNSINTLSWKICYFLQLLSVVDDKPLYVCPRFLRCTPCRRNIYDEEGRLLTD